LFYMCKESDSHDEEPILPYEKVTYMNYSKCAKCGCKLSEGDLKYRITIDIVEDYDGLLPDLQEGISEDIDILPHQIGESELEGLESEVYEEISFTLCKACTDCFSKDPLGDKSKFISLKMGISHLLH